MGDAAEFLIVNQLGHNGVFVADGTVRVFAHPKLAELGFKRIVL